MLIQRVPMPLPLRERRRSQRTANRRRDRAARLAVATVAGAAWRKRSTPVTVVLPDSTPVVLRPLTPVDRRLYLAGFERLSPESRLKRFLGPKPSLTEREIQYFTDVDHHDHEAIIAIIGGQGVGVARYVRDHDDTARADVAVAVIDEWQRRGVGSALLRRLVQRAAEEGIARLSADMLWTNRAIFATLRRLHASWRTTHSSNGVVEIEITLQPEVGAAPLDHVRYEPAVRT